MVTTFSDVCSVLDDFSVSPALDDDPTGEGDFGGGDTLSAFFLAAFASSELVPPKEVFAAVSLEDVSCVSAVFSAVARTGDGDLGGLTARGAGLSSSSEDDSSEPEATAASFLFALTSPPGCTAGSCSRGGNGDFGGASALSTFLVSSSDSSSDSSFPRIPFPCSFISDEGSRRGGVGDLGGATTLSIFSTSSSDSSSDSSLSASRVSSTEAACSSPV